MVHQATQPVTTFKQTAATRARYNRLAPLYDRMEACLETRLLAEQRKRFWSLVQGPQVLEIGVGTGKNMPYYPPGVQMTAVDLSEGMLVRAQQRARALGLAVRLHLMDAQSLTFPDRTFDMVIATCVFCSVPDPVQGLREARRVLKPGGKLLLLEHVRAESATLGQLMDWLNPLVVRLMGANINRRTVENVRRAGFAIEDEERLGGRGLVRFIQARPGTATRQEERKS